MGDEPGFSEKWDFRRQENNFDDSSSDDPDSNPIIHNQIPVLELDDGATTVTKEPPVKTRKMRSKKDESKPEKAKQVRRRKPKINVCAEENKKKKEETVMERDEVGMHMKTLLDELTASRESLMDWMNTELCGSSVQNVVSRPPPKRRAVAAVSVKKTRTKKKEEEKQEEICQDMNRPPKEKSSEIAHQNGGDQAQQLDYNAGPLDMFLRSGHGGLGKNCFKQQEQGQQGIVETNKKSVVLAIEAPKQRQGQKKTKEANTRSETQKDDNFVIPYVPQLSSSLQSFPLSNNNFQQGQVSQFSDVSEFQTGGFQGFENSLFSNNGYFSGFPASFQPSLMAGGYNLPALATSSQQQRDNNNMLGGLVMAGGSIRYSGNRFPESKVSNNSLSEYRTGSGR